MALAFTAPSSEAALIFADNFNAPNTNNLDNSDQTGRRSGMLADNVQVRSSRIQHGIIDNQLDFLKEATGSGRIRFHNFADLSTWWNFASGAAGAQILADGGLLVEFDWTPANITSDDWVSVNIGIDGQSVGEPGIRVNHPGTDFGILFRNNGGTQYFDNGAATTGGVFPPTLAQRHAAILFSFSSFADGSNVQVSATVDGVPVVTGQQFQWDSNSGVIHMEIGNLAEGTRLDNLSISSVPEPSTAALLSGGLLLLARRRRA